MNRKTSVLLKKYSSILELRDPAKSPFYNIHKLVKWSWNQTPWPDRHFRRKFMEAKLESKKQTSEYVQALI